MDAVKLVEGLRGSADCKRLKWKGTGKLGYRLLLGNREPELTTQQIAAELLQLDEYATLSASQRAELTSPEN